ncbi:MAG: tetratricopeptide repeat protein [Chthoniobacterales bacterium]
MNELDSSAPVSPTLARPLLVRLAADQLQKGWLRVLLLVFIGVAVRAPALSGELIWDDQYLARENPFIKSPLLVLETFRHYLFLDSFSGHYRPVQNISFIVDYFFWNTDAYGFHLTNVLLHVFSGVLLYFLLRKLLFPLQPAQEQTGVRFDLSWIAWFVALLWTVHPVHSAAVDYISGRADSLAFLFGCGGWLLVLAARASRKKLSRNFLYGIAAVSGLLALCSREIAGIWIAIFLLHIFCFEKRFSRRTKMVTLACCLALLSVYAGLRQLPDHRSGPGPSSSWSGPVRVVLMLRALGDYGRLMIFPSNLHMERSVVDGRDYGNISAWRASIGTEYLSIAGVLVLAVLTFGSLRRGQGQRVRLLGAAWFLLAYLPISNLFELNATVAEHWLYLPSVGFLLFVAGCCIDLPSRYVRGIAAVGCLAVVAFSVRSVVRSSDWVNAETFYERTIAAGGMSGRVGVNLGIIYTARGEHAKAEAVFRNVLKTMPDFPIARNDLADVLIRQGKKEEAEAILAAANSASVELRKEFPRTWIAALNLARLRCSEQDEAAARAILEKAQSDYPGIWEIISLESELVRRMDGPEAALRVAGNFARDNWWHYGAAVAVGRLLAEKGDAEGAERAFRHASRLDIHDAGALNLIASMRVRQNRLEEAYSSQRLAVARQPDQPRQYLILSDILEKMGRNDEARAVIAQVSRMQALAHSQSALN